MSARDLLIFDMDGVLVDVRESYRETIRETVKYFTDSLVDHDTIQEFKNQGGFNDDWDLSFRLIHDAGVEVGFDTVVDRFQKLFRGENGKPGLIERERWVAGDGLLDRLGGSYELAVFTGRFREEAGVTLNRFAPGRFCPVVGLDDVAAAKPAPDGLLKILAAVAHGRVFYLGDTVDDARSAQAAAVPFIGIVGADTPRRDETVEVLRACGALAVLRSINELEETLPKL